tara:strand:+ start:56054 stop:56848 length:795 start_codon:yes stop_codon:yes gene_type:complete
MTNEKEKVIMSCKGCVFANKIGITQVGCDLNNIETFRDSGTNVVEGYDDDEEFYIIERLCQFYRDENWSKNVSDPKQQVEKEVEISCGFIILHEYGKPLDDIKDTFKGIQQQEVAPRYVTLVVSKKEDNPFNIRHVCHEHFDYPNVEKNIPFNIVTMLNLDATDLEMVDEAFEKSLNGYYVIFRSGQKIPQNLTAKLNESVNTKLDQLSMVRAKDDKMNGLTVQCVVHKFLAGNRTLPLEEKIEIFAEETKRTSFIKDWDEVYG